MALINIGILFTLIIYIVVSVFGTAVPFSFIELLFSCQFIMIIGSKLPQILRNKQNKSMGVLSFSTALLQAILVLVRFVTIIFNNNKGIFSLPAALFILRIIINWTLLAQFFVYPALKQPLNSKKTV